MSVIIFLYQFLIFSVTLYTLKKSIDRKDRLAILGSIALAIALFLGIVF